jgi:hypothetical protein
MSGTAKTAGMIPVSRRVRAYFAPYDPVANAPTVFDPGINAGFSLEAPPLPWVDLGWIDNFRRSSGTKVQAMRAGSKGAAAGQFRSTLDASVEFDFRQWGKLQMALAGGSQHMNVLATDPSASPRASGGIPQAAVAVLTGSTASELIVGPGAADIFRLGDIIAVDLDYQQQTGYVGTGIAAAYVSDPANVLRDRDYVRRVTFNVARITQKTTTSLLLDQALIGGAPGNGACAQKVTAFVDREGGSFFQEWSGLFVWQDESGGRACFYYPHLSPTRSGNTSAGTTAETQFAIHESLGAIGLHAEFTAFSYMDPNDGETVVCYRSYFPAPLAGLY